MPIHQAIFLCFTLIVTVVSCNNDSSRPNTENPNIIIILADDMGYGDVSALNTKAKTKTPAIDELAIEGLVFTEAHASASVCTPSRYGLLTGRYAFRSEKAAYGIWGFEEPVIEPNRSTMASLLKEAGYSTACIGKWHLGLQWATKDDSIATLNSETGYSNVDYSKKVLKGPNDFGFDYSFIHPASLDIPPYVFLRNHQVVDPEIILTTDHYPIRKPDTEYAWDKKHTDEHAVYWEKGVWWRRGEMSKSFRIEECQNKILTEGKNFIAQHVQNNSDKPFFLYLPLTGPHTPWVPKEQFKGKSKIGLYGDFVMEVDDVVAQIKKTLVANNIYENTILIFSSDNGAYWPQEEIDLHGHDSNEGRTGQKGDIWDGGHRVPLIISWPSKIDRSVVCDQLVSLTDLYATFIDLLGLKKENGQGEDSFSFLHVLNGEINKPIRPHMIHHSSRGFYSIRKDNWKFIEGLGSGGFTDPAIAKPAEVGEIGQLYELSTDSLETNNLYLQNPDKVKELNDLLLQKKK